jgi:hypothetical protein
LQTSSTPKAPKLRPATGVSNRYFGGIAMAVLGLSFVLDPSQPLGPNSICPAQMLFSLPCPGCGLTRAITHISHGMWLKAVALHPLAPLVYLAIVITALSLIFRPAALWRDRFLAGEGQMMRLTAVIFAAFGVVWLVRLLEIGPLTPLSP